jgi:hypothetical protein
MAVYRDFPEWGIKKHPFIEVSNVVQLISTLQECKQGQACRNGLRRGFCHCWRCSISATLPRSGLTVAKLRCECLVNVTAEE